MNESQAAGEVMSASKSNAIRAAEELRAAAGAKAKELREAAETRASEFRQFSGDKGQHLREQAQGGIDKLKELSDTNWDEAKAKAQELAVEGEEYIRENPGKSILAALGVGFVIGLIFRR